MNGATNGIHDTIWQYKVQKRRILERWVAHGVLNLGGQPPDMKAPLAILQNFVAEHYSLSAFMMCTLLRVYALPVTTTCL